MELALALLALAAALPESGAPKGGSLTCSLFRDDIIGSLQSSRTTFFGRQAQVPVAIPAEHLYLLSQGAWIPGTHQHTEQPLVDLQDHDIEGQETKRISSVQLASLWVQALNQCPTGIAHQPCWLKSKPRRIPRRPARGPQDTQRGPQDAQREDPRTPSEDPRMPSARTPGCPVRGLHDAQREDPSPHNVHCATLLDLAKVITQNPAWDPGHTDTDTCPWDPPTVNPSTATGTPCTFPVGHAGPKTLDPGLPLSRETHLLTDELR